MKKLTIIATGLILSAFMFSCKKCQECTTDTSQNIDGFVQSTSTKSEYCGDSYDEAPTPGTYNNTVGSTTQTVTISCVDK